MKHFIRSSVLCAVSFALPLVAAAMNNNDVVKMQKAGLSEETILAAMQKEPAEYDTSVDALIALKGAGVSEAMIQKIIALKAVAAPAPAAPTAPSQASPAPTASPAPAPTPAPTAASAPVAPAANSPAWSSVLVPPADGSGAAAAGAPAPAVSAAFSQVLPSIAPPRIEPVVGQEYFTRFTFHEEKNEHVTTNYARGPIVPINTPVKLVSMSGSQLVLKRSDTGQDVKVKNEEKYTKKPIREIASMMLSAEKTPLEKLPAQLATAISNGEMRKGMTKELVLMARGYPPAHETASTDSDRWVYWSSRFVKHTIVFADGRLAEGRGLF